MKKGEGKEGATADREEGLETDHLCVLSVHGGSRVQRFGLISNGKCLSDKDEVVPFTPLPSSNAIPKFLFPPLFSVPATLWSRELCTMHTRHHDGFLY